MKQTLTFLFLIVALSIYSFGQEKMVSTKVNDDITMKLPESFVSMTDGERIEKFVSSKTPIGMYSSDDRTADLGINTNIMPWIAGDEEKLRSFYKGTFKTLFDEVNYLQDTVREINGRLFIVFEFVSTLKEENAFSGTTLSKNYSYIQYTSYKGQILLFNFGCKPRQMAKWQALIKASMESIKIRG